MTPLAILLERADAALRAHGASARDALIRQIEAAIREGENAASVRDLDHILQLVEFRDRALEPGPIDDMPERFVRWTGEAMREQ